MSNPKITVSVRWLMDNWLWEEYCEVSGTSLWAVNEGQIDSDENVEVPAELMRRVASFLVSAAVETDGYDDAWTE
ncbi:hypothetical protein HN588_06070 [Candidatus Bathyarchaeota archaeon]|jgi:hypothetical protein|nr:hypothetical protein [Candidatus Bathyarchaeota archaeon]